MNYTENTVLSVEERILLASLEETDTNRCIAEIEKFAMTIPFTDETFPLLMNLRYKLKHDYVDIKKEIENIPDDYTEDF